MGSTYNIEEIPAELKDAAESAYLDLVTAISDLDEEIGMLFLEEKPISKEQLKAGIRRQTILNKFVPSRAVPPSRTRACNTSSTP